MPVDATGRHGLALPGATIRRCLRHPALRRPTSMDRRPGGTIGRALAPLGRHHHGALA
jgi:hypothetical protein